ncbi:MAG: DUF4157 domain-containing protein [Acidobacteriia bacterium]|nr:DUF4157 domain-containing protein [Terriglobia bacterium]
MSETQRLSKPKDKSHVAPPAAAAEPTRASVARSPAWASAPAGAPFALGGVQRKVAIGASNDAYERQADQVAGRVASGGTVPPGSISPIAPAFSGPVSRQAKPAEKKKDDALATPPVQRVAKPEEKRKNEKPAAAPVQREVKPEDSKKDPKAAGARVQRQTKPEEKKKDTKPAPSIQRAAKPEEKKKDDKPPAPIQRQAKPEEKKKDEKPAAAPVQRAAKPEEKRKDDKPASPPVHRAAKPEEKKKDDKPPAPVQREIRPEDKKKEETPGTLPIQRADLEGEESANGPVQTSRAGGGRAAAAPSMESAAAHAISTKGPGEPLNSATRGALESGMGTGLSDVRIHNDSSAQQAASDLNARAFTHQNDIWLGPGESQSDTRLMAHEAAHVVQQTGSVHRMLVQRAEVKTADKGGADDPKTGIVKPDKKTITFDEIEIPSFKAKDHRGEAYEAHKPLIRKRDYQRGEPKQRDKWKNEVKTAEIAKQLKAKAEPTNKGLPQATSEYVFKVPTRGKGGKPFAIGTIDEIAKEMTIPYWGGKGKTPETKFFDVDHIVELQLANWNGKAGWPNELPNMELLESGPNRSSGSLIANAIDKKVAAYLKKLNAAGAQASSKDKEAKAKGAKGKGSKQDKSGVEQIKQEYDLIFEKATGKGGPTVGPASYWKQDQIEKGEHLGPVEPSSLDEIAGKGKVLIFPGEHGGVGKSFSWTEKDDKANEPRSPEGKYEPNWLKPFVITEKKFATSGEGVEKSDKLGHLTIHIPKNAKWKEQEEHPLDIMRIPGARYAGYVNAYAVRRQAEKIEKKGASPLKVNEFEILPDEGIHVSGQLITDIPLIKGAGIDLELRGDEFRISKTFKVGEFKVPKPFSVTNSSLTVFASTEKQLGIEGEANFAIDKVGEGYLKGGASGGGFNLAGGFEFDKKLFDDFRVDMRYEKDVFSVEGHLAIKEGKLKGVKSASFTIGYKEGRIDASGTVKPHIPAVEQGELTLSYSEAEGLVIAGSVELKKDVPGIAGGTLRAQVTKKPGEDRYIVKASGEATPKIPGISSKLMVSYDDGAFDATVTAGYEKGMLKGSVTVGATNRPVGDDGKPGEVPAAKADKITVYGGGSVTLKLAPWLQATAGIRFLPNGEVEVTGQIGLPSALNLFDEKKVDKSLFKINIDIPIFGLSVLGHHIGVFLEIGGGLDLSAGIGPGQLQDVNLGVKYNPAHEDETEVHGHAALHIPAHAGLRLFVSAALGAGIPIVDAKAGLELGGSLGVEGALHADVDVDWTPKKGLVLDANAEIYAEPKFKFDITGFVLVEVDLLFTTKTLYEKRWELAALEYGSGLRFGMKLPVHYEEGKPFNISLSDIQFEKPDIDPMATLKGLFDKIV